MNFEGKVVWITGASSGIGAAFAKAFNTVGSKVVLSARREDQLKDVQDQLPRPEQSLILPLDVTDFDMLHSKTQQVLDHFGQIDIVIQNAGISQRSLVKDTDLSVYERIMNVNFMGVIALTKAVLPHMTEQQQGQFVVISSVVGKVGTPLRSGYAASKHAVEGFFDSLRAEVVKENIKVTIICPGYVRTEVSRNALSGDGSKHGQMDGGNANGLSPEDFVKKAMKAIVKEKREVYIGGREIMAIYLKRFLPGVLAKMVARVDVTG